MSKFSDVSIAYSNNLKNLDEARQVFEKECKVVNEKIINFAEEQSAFRNKNLPTHLRKTFLWSDNVSDEGCSKIKGHWANFIQETRLSIHIKGPTRKKFERDVAFLSFELSFDSNMGRFMCKVLFLNEYAKHDQLDEKLAMMATGLPDKFPMAKHMKPSLTQLCLHEVNDELHEKLESIVKDSMDLVQDMIDKEFPALLEASVVEDSSPTEQESA